VSEGLKVPLTAHNPSVYGLSSHIEGEGGGEIESQLILGFRHTDSQPKSGKVS